MATPLQWRVFRSLKLTGVFASVAINPPWILFICYDCKDSVALPPSALTDT